MIWCLGFRCSNLWNSDIRQSLQPDVKLSVPRSSRKLIDLILVMEPSQPAPVRPMSVSWPNGHYSRSFYEAQAEPRKPQTNGDNFPLYGPNSRPIDEARNESMQFPRKWIQLHGNHYNFRSKWVQLHGSSMKFHSAGYSSRRLDEAPVGSM
jgi:hypothetical protein